MTSMYRPMTRAQARVFDKFLADLQAGRNPSVLAVLKAHRGMAGRLRPALVANEWLHREFARLRKSDPKALDEMLKELDK